MSITTAMSETASVTTAEQVARDRFERDGFIAPLQVVNREDAAVLRRRFHQLEERDGGRLASATRKKPHLLVPWLADIVRHPAIVGPVANLLGPDVLCWSSLFFAKGAGEGTYVAWHQDATLSLIHI